MNGWFCSIIEVVVLVKCLVREIISEIEVILSCNFDSW